MQQRYKKIPIFINKNIESILQIIALVITIISMVFSRKLELWLTDEAKGIKYTSTLSGKEEYFSDTVKSLYAAEHGYIENNEYVNEYFDISIPFPEGWNVFDWYESSELNDTTESQQILYNHSIIDFGANTDDNYNSAQAYIKYSSVITEKWLNSNKNLSILRDNLETFIQKGYGFTDCNFSIASHKVRGIDRVELRGKCYWGNDIICNYIGIIVPKGNVILHIDFFIYSEEELSRIVSLLE